MKQLARGCTLLFLLITLLSTFAQAQSVPYTEQEKGISEQLHTLRQLPDAERASLTRELALGIRALPITTGKVRLANALQNLSTEGDFGHDTLQDVTDTLSFAIQEYERTGKPDPLPYGAVAWMVRYGGVKTTLTGPKYMAAMADLEASERVREAAGFTLSDLQGTSWTLSDLKGEVVVVNFWATWCPPCRKEIPDLRELYAEFKDRGLVILGIADDETDKLKAFVAEQKIGYPVLPDTDRKVHTAFRIEGIPATMVYDRRGKLIAQAFDVQTRKQLLNLLGQAGLK